MKLTIVLPLPSRVLSPNVSAHYLKKSNAAKKARRDGGYAALHAMNEAGIDKPRWKSATAKCRFYFRHNRGQDGDNALASLKHALDGLADAGLVVNDKVIRYLGPEVLYDKANPRVEIEVCELNSANGKERA